MTLLPSNGVSAGGTVERPCHFHLVVDARSHYSVPPNGVKMSDGKWRAKCSALARRKCSCF